MLSPHFGPSFVCHFIIIENDDNKQHCNFGVTLNALGKRGGRGAVYFIMFAKFSCCCFFLETLFICSLLFAFFFFA